MSTSPSSTNGTPAAPEVPQDCQEGVLGFFHTLERLKVRVLFLLGVDGQLTSLFSLFPDSCSIRRSNRCVDALSVRF